MNNKLIFRILGALASALIIASVFVPYVSISGYTQNLWNSYETVNSLYLPIMIIVFGVIGVIFFALNIKTEFAYMTTGAILFFLVMQTIVYMDTFTALSLGYYFQAVGAIVTGIMAFLCNLRTKVQKEVEQSVEENTQASMLDQIDRLYNEQQTQESVQTIQPIDAVVQPISVEPIQNIESVEPIQPETSVELEQQLNQVPELQPQVVETNNLQQSIPEIQSTLVVDQPVNPVLQEFSQKASVPVGPGSVVEQSQVQPEIQLVQEPQPINPVLQQFNFGNVNSQSIMEPQKPVQPQELVQPVEPVSPVLQEFTNSGSPIINNTQNTNDSSLDIFGQPINK